MLYRFTTIKKMAIYSLSAFLSPPHRYACHVTHIPRCSPSISPETSRSMNGRLAHRLAIAMVLSILAHDPFDDETNLETNVASDPSFLVMISY